LFGELFSSQAEPIGFAVLASCLGGRFTLVSTNGSAPTTSADDLREKRNERVHPGDHPAGASDARPLLPLCPRGAASPIEPSNAREETTTHSVERTGPHMAKRRAKGKVVAICSARAAASGKEVVALVELTADASAV
jgi:hypothetical protein